MKIMEVKERTPMLVEQLLAVWEDSVRATHLFLSDEEINNIKPYVPQTIEGVAVCIWQQKQDSLWRLWERKKGLWRCCSLRLQNGEKDWESNCWNGQIVMKK